MTDWHCQTCGNTGLVVIPVRECVWQRRLILHPALRRVVTGAVICDRPGCSAGAKLYTAQQRDESADTKRHGKLVTLSKCEALANCDLPALLAEYEAAQVAKARAENPPDSATEELFARVMRRFSAAP
jgi:hypothetical protein